MASTINNYSVGLTLDAKQYIDASKLSRAETRALISDINKARDPAEDFTRAENRLTKAFQEGAINLQTYNRLLEHHKKKLDDAQQSTNQKASGLERMAQYATIATGAIATARAGIDAFASAKSAFDEVANRIANTSDQALTLGLRFNELASLRFAAQQAGASIDAIEGAIKEMMKRGFADGDVRESFLSIADEISGMADQTERMQRAYEVFGKKGSEVLLMLQEGRAAIEENVMFADKWSNLTDSQAIAAEQYGDALDRVSLIVSSIAETFVAELAPLLESFLINAEDGMSAFDNLDQFARDTADNLAIGLGVLQDAYEITTAWYDVMKKLAMGDFSGAIKTFNEAVTIDKSEKNLQQLYDIRAKNDKLASERAMERDRMRKEKQIEDIKEVQTIEETKVENFDNLYKQALETTAKEFERKAAEAKKIADSIAKGPADIEAGSAEAARFLAEQTSRQLADGMMSDAATASETAMLEEAAKQLEQLMAVNDKQTAQVDALKQLVEITSQNGFRRLR